MDYSFQKNGFLKNDAKQKQVDFKSIRKTPEEIRQEMIKLRSSNKKIDDKKSTPSENYYKNRIDAIKNIRKI